MTSQPVFATPRKGLSDVNRDGVVSIADLTIVNNNSGLSPTGVTALSDVNQNGSIDISDIAIVAGNANYTLTACELEDINNDGVVNSADLAIVNGYLGQTDSSTNMIADMDGDGSITSADVAKVQNCIPAVPATTTINTVPPISPNSHPNWKYEVMAGPNFIGSPSFIGDQNVNVFINSSTHHDDMRIAFIYPKISDIPVLPWVQGLNTVSEIINVNIVSAFNGFNIIQTDNPYTLILSYDLNRLFGLSPSNLTISHFEADIGRWQKLTSPQIINYLKHSIATTTNKSGLFAITYPSSVWQNSPNLQ